MMWFVAIALVVVLGGVAAVAAGRLGSLPEAERRLGELPGDGEVTSTDLRRVRFSIALRGYRMAEVDALLDRLAGQLDRPEG